MNDDLRAGPAAGKLPRTLRSGLIVCQVALSTILLAGSAMLLRTVSNARAEDPTLQPENLLTVELQPGLNGYNGARGAAFYREALRRAESVPGVRSAALIFVPPFEGRRGGTDIVLRGKAKQEVDFNAISAGYFQTIGVRLTRGREFNSRDTEGSPAVAAVNESFAARFWPGEDPIGKHFHIIRTQSTVTVVGVARDSKFRGYRDALRPEVYIPLAQFYLPQVTMEVRTAIPASQLTIAMRRQIQAIDPAMPLNDIRTMQMRLDDSLSQERLLASLATGLGALALALAAMGIYGVLSFAVSRRKREIGVRIALGAQRREIAGLILRQSAALTAPGLVIGACGAYALARLASNLLYGVAPDDATSFAAASASLATVAILAAAAPAYRAASIDPAGTLRGD